MTIRLAICAIFVSMLATSASATGQHWGDWGNWCNWEQSDNNFQWDKDREWNRRDLRKLKRLFKRFGQYADNWCDWEDKQWEKDCDWGKEWDRCDDQQDRDDCERPRRPRRDKCKPNAVPTPTAAIAGLGMMGLMLTRRRNKQG